MVLPSLEDNCPMAVLEAMAAGVPVVASKIGGVPDLVDHERTGLLFNPKDVASLGDSVERLLANPAWAARVAESAKERALAWYHPRIIALKHLDIYRELCRRPS